MSLIEGQKLNLHNRGRNLSAEIVKKEWMNPNDQFPGPDVKRDANPIIQVTVHVAGLDHELVEQIEMTDENHDHIDHRLEEIFSDALIKYQQGERGH